MANANGTAKNLQGVLKTALLRRLCEMKPTTLDEMDELLSSTTDLASKAMLNKHKGDLTSKIEEAIFHHVQKEANPFVSQHQTQQQEDPYEFKGTPGVALRNPLSNNPKRQRLMENENLANTNSPDWQVSKGL